MTKGACYLVTLLQKANLFRIEQRKFGKETNIFSVNKERKKTWKRKQEIGRNGYTGLHLQ